MSDEVLFEHSHRGYVWRLVVSDYNGSTFANFRKWYDDGDMLKPTKEGMTFPVHRLAKLHAALDAYLG